MTTKFNHKIQKSHWGLIIMLLFFSACYQGEPKVNNKISETEISQIKQIIKDYEKGWLTNDSALILGLFSDKAMLIPSGMQPITGKNVISKWWWPNDSSKTTINKYKIDLLEVEGMNDLAYTFEHGSLSWSYEKKGLKFSKNQESHEVTIFRKNELGKWEIIKRIWTDLEK